MLQNKFISAGGDIMKNKFLRKTSLKMDSIMLLVTMLPSGMIASAIAV